MARKWISPGRNSPFEWDEEKEKINIAKHGIDFATASHVFLDPDRLEYYDEKHSTSDEDRYITIDFVGDVLTVVYTERIDALRIISARIATKKGMLRHLTLNHGSYDYRITEIAQGVAICSTNAK